MAARSGEEGECFQCIDVDMFGIPVKVVEGRENAMGYDDDGQNFVAPVRRQRLDIVASEDIFGPSVNCLKGKPQDAKESPLKSTPLPYHHISF